MLSMQWRYYLKVRLFGQILKCTRILTATQCRCFHHILNMLVSKEFYRTYVKLPHNEVPPEIRDDGRFFPYFEHCRGAVDGSLLDAFVLVTDMAHYRSRKGQISTNLLAACGFNLQFVYMLAGWEESAADGRVFEDAWQKDFAIPPGTYYLGDAGFPMCNALIVLYHGVRYHLKEWEQANLR